MGSRTNIFGCSKIEHFAGMSEAVLEYRQRLKLLQCAGALQSVVVANFQWECCAWASYGSWWSFAEVGCGVITLWRLSRGHFETVYPFGCLGRYEQNTGSGVKLIACFLFHFMRPVVMAPPSSVC